MQHKGKHKMQKQLQALEPHKSQLQWCKNNTNNKQKPSHKQGSFKQIYTYLCIHTHTHTQNTVKHYDFLCQKNVTGEGEGEEKIDKNEQNSKSNNFQHINS